MNKIRKTTAALDYPIVLWVEIIVGDNDNVYTPSIMVDKDILEFVHSFKNITDADYDTENEINKAPVPTSSEIRNDMKSMRSYLDSHSNVITMEKKVAIASRRSDFYLLVHGRYFIFLLPPIGNQWRHSPIRHQGTRPLGVTGSPVIDSTEGLVIFSDSKSAIEAIRNGEANISYDIITLLEQLHSKRKSCILLWIPAHVHIEGHEDSPRQDKIICSMQTLPRSPTHAQSHLGMPNLRKKVTKNGNGPSEGLFVGTPVQP
ncbi:hypothetical protein TNCV_4076081 [Trichonephila clavipes]|nr:hypothetical protein TNCV_4076081 [Trichonephila clavipes]